MKLRMIGCYVGLALLVGVSTGCVVLVAGAAGGGTISYVTNELRATEPAALDKVLVAVRGAAQDIRFVALSEKSDLTHAIWRGQNALEQPVIVELKRLSDKATEIHIRVGSVSTSQNRAAAELFYNKMKARL